MVAKVQRIMSTTSLAMYNMAYKGERSMVRAAAKKLVVIEMVLKTIFGVLK